MNLFVETFGCQMNAADSEEMAGRLEAADGAYRQALVSARAARTAAVAAVDPNTDNVLEQIKARGKHRQAEKQAEARLREIGLTP